MSRDIARVNQYRQFKENVRRTKNYLVIGIDIAKSSHYAFFGTPDGKTILRRFIFNNNVEGFEKLITMANSLCRQNGLDKMVFGIEPTGNFHKPLANYLVSNQYFIVMVTGKAVRNNRQLLDGRWDKNDVKDSANVADLIAQGKCQYYDQPDENMLDLKKLLSLRKRLKKTEQRLILSIRNSLITKYFPEFDAHSGVLKGINLTIVEHFLNPVKIASMGFSEFCSRVTVNKATLPQRRRLQAIYDAAGRSIGCPVTSCAELEAQILVEQLRNVRGQIDQIMCEIEEICQGIDNYHRLRSIPGFGPYIAALVLSVIGDPMRFQNRKQVIKLSGFDLNASRSGKNSREQIPIISKNGDGDLRFALFQAAIIASRFSEKFQKQYTRLVGRRVAERGIKKKVRVKMASKLLIIAWTLMKNKEMFDVNKIVLSDA